MRASSVAAIACTVGMLSAGCARRGTIGDPLLPEAPPEPVTLEVANNNWGDVVIYAIRGTQRIRLVTVVATNTASIVLPTDLMGPGGEVRIGAYPIGGRHIRYVSPRVYAQPGAIVYLTIESDLRRSTVAVW